MTTEKAIKVEIELLENIHERVIKCNLTPEEMRERKSEVEQIFNENAVKTNMVWEIAINPGKGWNCGIDENGMYEYVLAGKRKE